MRTLIFTVWLAVLACDCAAVELLPRALDLVVPDGGALTHSQWFPNNPPAIAPKHARLHSLFDEGVDALLTNNDLNVCVEHAARIGQYLNNPPTNVDRLANAEEVSAAILLCGTLMVKAERFDGAMIFLRGMDKFVDQMGSPVGVGYLHYLRAAASAKIDANEALQDSRLSYESLRVVRHDFPRELVFAGSQLICLTVKANDNEAANELASRLRRFAESRKDKLGLAFAHLCWADAVRLAALGDDVQSKQVAAEGRLVVENVTGIDSASSAFFRALQRSLEGRASEPK